MARMTAGSAVGLLKKDRMTAGFAVGLLTALRFGSSLAPGIVVGTQYFSGTPASQEFSLPLARMTVCFAAGLLKKDRMTVCFAAGLLKKDRMTVCSAAGLLTALRFGSSPTPFSFTCRPSFRTSLLSFFHSIGRSLRRRHRIPARIQKKKCHRKIRPFSPESV